MASLLKDCYTTWICSNMKQQFTKFCIEYTVTTVREIKPSYMAISFSKYNTNISNLLYTPR